VIGRPLRIEEISPEEAKNELRDIFPAFIMNLLLNTWAAGLGQPAYMTCAVAEITGAPPRTFRQWATDHAAAFRA
jgi:hypothetical protein